MSSRTIATPTDSFSRSPPKLDGLRRRLGRPPPATSWKTAGMISAATASRSIERLHAGRGAVEVCRSRLSPPTNIAAPMTSRMLPRIEPTSEALTTSCSPSWSAKKAMISSGALPNVTLRKPPMPGPERAASSSVARPISAAVGITPSAEAAKISGASAWASSSSDRDRDERDEQVRPAFPAEEEAAHRCGPRGAPCSSNLGSSRLNLDHSSVQSASRSLTGAVNRAGFK